MRVLVTGGAGFVGSHAAEFYANKGFEVRVFDNMSRALLLGKDDKNAFFNWNYLKRFNNIELIKGDVRNFNEINNACKDVDVAIHAAAQTAVTSSVKNPSDDFHINALGTFNTLEAARKNNVKKFVYCSTNKVYGNNINNIGIIENEGRYNFKKEYGEGILENFPIDLNEHSPYGCSKLAGDLYAQDYAYIYGLKTAVFRMSCIYGPRQFGFEDQGWAAWFTIAALTGKQITIYGDGKQVRDVLYANDLIEAYDKFINSKIKHSVYNIGGGFKNTLSLLELINILKELSGKEIKLKFADWRPSDQKVFISNIAKLKKELKWEPKVNAKEGIAKLFEWVKANKMLF